MAPPPLASRLLREAPMAALASSNMSATSGYPGISCGWGGDGGGGGGGICLAT